ncbi:MAG: hypothetical protein HYW26_04635 [Candidatus Aenigmarchaeota archaeon]|nr:hypothetical protein [Candidatus Aenigmarchaeota archaeon]
MHGKYLLLIIGIIIIALIGFFFPRNIGGILCGPVCPPHGLHYYEQSCFGMKYRFIHTNCSDCGYSDICFGIPTGEKRCFGVPYTETENFESREIGCNYPCNDENVKIMCQNQENITFDGLTYFCDGINRKCNW